jgi:predicted  nucleic acid-binding Zn-ribbon protein
MLILTPAFQEENRTENESYNKELNKLRGETQKLQMEQANIRDQMVRIRGFTASSPCTSDA